jgi:antirestriction protein ArdC
MSASIYQIVTDRITALLEKGVVPWQKNWSANQQPPQNLVSRKPYRGINILLLQSMGYTSPYWLTFKQAQELGGYVKQGQKGCPVVFWRWLDVENKVTGETEHIPFLRYYTVFNVAQCEGISVLETTAPANENTPIQAAEQIVAGMLKRPEITHGFNQAFYSPPGDFVAMPAVEQFKSTADYFATLFHELTHSTGHGSRLNRKAVSGSEGKMAAFGSDPYGKEELVAEMGSAFLCCAAGIADRTIENSAAYVGAWLKRLKSDPKLVVQAAGQAQKAADYILGRNEEIALAE